MTGYSWNSPSYPERLNERILLSSHWLHIYIYIYIYIHTYIIVCMYVCMYVYIYIYIKWSLDDGCSEIRHHGQSLQWDSGCQRGWLKQDLNFKRGGISRPVRDFLEISRQQILVGIILVARLGVCVDDSCSEATDMYMYMYMYMCMYICIYVYMYICIYVSLSLYIYMYIYIYICTYTYIYIYIYIYSVRSNWLLYGRPKLSLMLCISTFIFESEPTPKLCSASHLPVPKKSVQKVSTMFR